MLRNVFLKSLRDQFKAILAWGLSLASLAYLTMLFYPTIASSNQFDELLKQMPQLQSFLGDVASFTTIEGYVTSQLLTYTPVILSIYVILAYVGSITGEIETGSMDFLLAHPLPRWRVALEKYAAVALALVAICLILGLGMWLGGVTIGRGPGILTWLGAAFNMVPVTLLYGSVAYMLACALRGRGIPVGVAAGLAIAGFILNGLAPLVDALRPHRAWTIYYLFTSGKPFSTGINAGYTAILIGGTLVCLVLGVLAFTRRDILA